MVQDGRKKPASNAGSFAALQHRAFLLLWLGALVSNVGGWMEVVSQSWLIFDRTKDPSWSGWLFFGNAIPSVLLVVPMGVIADRFDRRWLLFGLQVLMCAIAALQAWAAHVGYTEPWMLVSIAVLGGLASGASSPVWHAIVPSLVPREHLSGAIALNSAQFNVARVIGPLVAAPIIAKWGVAYAFDINVVSFILVIIAAWCLPSSKGSGKPRRDWVQELKEGFAFAANHKGVLRILIVSGGVCCLAPPLISQFTELARLIAPDDVNAYTALLSAMGIGAVVGAIMLSRLVAFTRRQVIAWGTVGMATTFGGLALSRSLPVSIAITFAFGIGWCVVLTQLSTALQFLAPEALRGRVMSLNVFTWVLLAPIGHLSAGYLARGYGLPKTLAVLGGGIFVLGAWQVLRPEPGLDGEGSRKVSERTPVACPE